MSSSYKTYSYATHLEFVFNHNVEDLGPAFLKNLNYMFSVKDKIYHRFVNEVYKIRGRSLIVPKWGFEPIVALLNKNSSYVGKIYVETKEEDTLSADIKLRPNVDFRDDIQIDSYNFVTKEFDTFGNYSAMLNLATGMGKTFIAIAIAATYLKKTLIVVDRLNLMEQWKREFSEFTTVPASRISELNNMALLKRILFGQPTPKDTLLMDSDVFIVTYKSLGLLDDFREDAIDMLMKKLGIGFKVFDEAHLMLKSLFKIDSSCNIMYNLYLTATPKRTLPEETVLMNYTLPFEHSKKVVGVPHVIVERVAFNSQPPNNLILKIYTKKFGFDEGMWNDYILNNEDIREDFFECILDAYESMYEDLYIKESPTRIGIVFRRLVMLEAFYDYLVINRPQLKDKIGCLVTTFKGSNTPKKEKNRIINSCEIIMSTEKSFSTGLDIRDLVGIINTVPFSSDVLSTQIIGRMRKLKNRKSMFIDFRDEGFQYLIATANSRKRIFEKEGITYKEMRQVK